MRLDHPIFQSPLAVEVTLDADHPYEDARDGQGTWLVHSGEFGKGCDVGMVSDGHGFEDSPDCERISGGINSKGARAIAIGRQANLLQWGFYGAPDRMTESAKRAFLNAIVYMRRFDGDAPLVTKSSIGRTWLLQYIDTLAGMKAEQLQDTGKNSYASYLKGQFPAGLVEDPIDPARLRAWYEANEEYLTTGSQKRSLVVDEDLAQRQLSNRTPAFLDWLLATLAARHDDVAALELARRYLGPEHAGDAATAVAWITQHRPFLFFTDTGGYRWLVDTNAQRRAARPAPPAKTGGG